jgi:hypothetical protein
MGNTDTDNRINYFVEQSRLRGLEDPLLIDNGIAQSLTWRSERTTVKAFFGSRFFVTVNTTECVTMILEYPEETDSQILDSISEHLAG